GDDRHIERQLGEDRNVPGSLPDLELRAREGYTIERRILRAAAVVARTDHVHFDPDQLHEAHIEQEPAADGESAEARIALHARWLAIGLVLEVAARDADEARAEVHLGVSGARR